MRPLVTGPTSDTVRTRILAPFAWTLALALMVFGVAIDPQRAEAQSYTTTFIESSAPLAQATQREFGVPASVSIAQAILESGWGTSDLTTEANAYFGIKCTSQLSPYQLGCTQMPTWEYLGGVNVTIYAGFRTYRNVGDSYLDHGHFLRTNSRYDFAFNTKTADDFARALQTAGYATDPAYASKLIGLMNTYNLRKYDTSVPSLNLAGGIGTAYAVLDPAIKVALGNQTSNEKEGPSGGARMVEFSSGAMIWTANTGAHAVTGDIWNTYRGNPTRVGAPTTDPKNVAGGVAQHFQFGMLTDTTASTNWVVGGIYSTWREAGDEAARYGLPQADERKTDEGWVQSFTFADVHYSSAGGTIVKFGMADRYRDTNAPALGWPVNNERQIPQGAAQDFRNGHVFWTPAAGTTAVLNGIRNTYDAYGGVNLLGTPQNEEYAVNGGSQQDFQNGSVQWSPQASYPIAFAVHSRYAANGGFDGFGFATSGEKKLGDGVIQDFQKAQILWSPTTGAHALSGGIRNTYLAYGGFERFGFPTSEEVRTERGVYQRFERGTVAWSNGLGSFPIQGGVEVKYFNSDGPNALDVPMGPEVSIGSGVAQRFVAADIFWNPNTGTYVVRSMNRNYYNSRGGAAGSFGYPTSDEYSVGGASVQNFEHAMLIRLGMVNYRVVPQPLMGAYERAGGPAGSLGLPIGDASMGADGVWSQDFAGGTLRAA